jgi:hypothetical protein
VAVVNLVLLAVAGFLAFWAGVVSLIGFAGWKPLAQRFPAGPWPEGEGRRLRWQSARIGLSNYNGVLNAVLTAEGLYLKPTRFFAYNHPPVFIPWGAVRGTRAGLLGGLVLELEGGGALALRGRVAKEVEAALDAWAAAGPLVEAAGRLPLDAEAPSADSPPTRSGWRQRT